MSREIKDIMDRHSKKKVYPRTHIKAVLMDSETSLETFLGENIPYRILRLENIITDTGDVNYPSTGTIIVPVSATRVA